MNFPVNLFSGEWRFAAWIALSLAWLWAIRSAPWQLEPNERSIEPGAPVAMYEQRPMSPGTSTGWPTARYASGTSG